MKITILITFMFSTILLQAQLSDPITLNQSAGSNLGAVLEAGDIDGDGIIELILMHSQGVLMFELGEYLEDGWVPTILFPGSSSNPLHLELSDIDDDGDLDIFYINLSTLNIFLNNGVGEFNGLTIDLQFDVTGNFCREIGAGDIDNDGDTDLAVAIDNYSLWIENINSWTENTIHSITNSGEGFRGAELYDWDSDGDLDVITLPGLPGTPIVVYMQNSNSWNANALTGTEGGVYSLDFADYDNDGDMDMGASANGQMNFVDIQSSEVNTIASVGGLPTGGSFQDFDGDIDLEWVQCTWSDGIVSYIDFNDGQPTDFVDSGIQQTYMDDMVFMDADQNGTMDLIYSCYFGGITLGVIPDIFTFTSIIETETKPDIQLSYFQNQLFINGTDLEKVKDVQIIDIEGKILARFSINSYDRWSTEIDLQNGYYIAILTTANSKTSLPFVAQ